MHHSSCLKLVYKLTNITLRHLNYPFSPPDQLNLVKKYLHPVVSLSRQGKLEKCAALDFVNSFYQLKLKWAYVVFHVHVPDTSTTCFSYATNISMYLYLASSEVNVKNHPILSRLEQYRQLVEQMEGIFNDVVREQVECIIEVPAIDVIV